MDDVGVFGVEDVGGGGEVFGIVVGVGVFGVGVVVVVAVGGEDVFGDELGDEFAELAHVEGTAHAHAHAHVTSAATSAATSMSAPSAPSAPAAPVVVVRTSVMGASAVVRGTAPAMASEGEAGTEGVAVGFRASVVGWGALAGRWGWGWRLEGVVVRAFLGWGTGFFAGFWVVGSSEGV